jgi:3-phenylpropionate/trans-cinnamate dioxygenase ferredoxin reductase subunit
MQQITVVGNGVAGWACAKRLGEQGVPVTLVGPGLPHDRPPLSKRALTSGRIPWSTSSDGLAELGIAHVDGMVTDVDVDTRQLTVATDGGVRTLGFGPLVWATGFTFPRPPVPGLDGERVHQNHESIGTAKLHERLTSVAGQRVVVIGAGLIGTESAASVAGMGHTVTLVDMLPRPLSRLPKAAGDVAFAALGQLGVVFHGDCRITAVEHTGSTSVVHTTTHGDIPADTVIVAAGFGSSLPTVLAPEGSLMIDVDETLRVSDHVDVWACGDCITFPHPRWGRIAIPHWDHAFQSGRHVAEAILGDRTPYARDPYWFSDIGPLRLQLVGMAERADTWGDENGLLVGRDQDGQVAAVMLINAPARLNEAREYVAAGLIPTHVH